MEREEVQGVALIDERAERHRERAILDSCSSNEVLMNMSVLF
jgi:hypothetical protein